MSVIIAVGVVWLLMALAVCIPLARVLRKRDEQRPPQPTPEELRNIGYAPES